MVETSFFWLNQPKLDEQEDLTGFNPPKILFPLVSWFVGRFFLQFWLMTNSIMGLMGIPGC